MARKNRVEDFHTKYSKLDTGCWLWDGAKNRKGYGQFRFLGVLHIASRFSYVIHKGNIGHKHVLHTCDTPSCVNPEHLFLGDNFVNQRDRVDKNRHWKLWNTHCPQGHEYTEENTRLTKRGHRCCRICEREMCKRHYKKYGRKKTNNVTPANM